MSINSIAFLIFLLISVLSYYAVPRRGRWVVLLFAGAFFYLSYSLRASVYLGVTILLTYGAGRWLGSMNRRQKDEAEGLSRREKAEVKKRWTRQKRRVLAAALLVNFLTLAVFKYFDAWFETLNRILALISADFSFRPLNLLLPLGISFYIFQTSGYLIDIYRGREQEERNFFRYALFASYFPQMIQGPINRYGDLGRQLKQEHTFRAENIRDGIQLMIWGMLKKTFIADTLTPGVSEIYSNYGNYSGAVVFFGAVLYCLQLYCDFSGGIDIVRGASNLFGIRMAENFRRPYFAASIDEFWRRWHISLGEWMKDYLFYPLALSKWMTKLGKRVRAVFGDRVGKLTAPCGATVIVFLAVGIWQGPGLSNVAYGLWNGCLMSAAMFFAPQLRRINSALHLDTESRGMHAFRVVRTCFLVAAGRYFSGAASLTAALGMIKQTVTAFTWNLSPAEFLSFGLAPRDYLVAAAASFVLFFVSLQQERGIRLREKLAEKPWFVQFVPVFLSLSLLTVCVWLNSDYTAISYVYENV